MPVAPKPKPRACRRESGGIAKLDVIGYGAYPPLVAISTAEFFHLFRLQLGDRHLRRGVESLCGAHLHVWGNAYAFPIGLSVGVD